MGKFEIEISPAASRDLDDLDLKIAVRVLSELRTLEDNPFPRGKLIKKIKGKKNSFYRLRVDKIRAYFEVKPLKIVILRIISRKDAERFIKGL
jgi:mRNA interferase RelE/StbE